MNRLTKKVLICCGVLLAAAVVIFLIAAGSPDTDADSYHQYAGTIIGGFATMTAVVVALLDRSQDRAVENVPRLRLGLRAQDSPVINQFVFFNKNGPNDSVEQQGIPLVIENKGATEIRIKGIFVGKWLDEKDKNDPGIWLPYKSYSLEPGDEANKLNIISGAIDIGSGLSLPVSVSEKRYGKDGKERPSSAGMNHFLVDIYFNNEFYDSSLFFKRYQVDQPLRSSEGEWWKRADVRLIKTEKTARTIEQICEEMKAASFTRFTE
ncbi:MAG: hypothetical protein IKE37_00275 [Firmicutes bacterium]|nr:hypothetical protein [Bacillota bacterium]